MKINKMKFNKINILIGVLMLWFVLSATFLSWRIIQERKVAIFNQGYTSAFNDLITQAENEECLAFPIFSGERRVDLVNIQCLQQPTEEVPVPVEETPVIEQ